MESRTIYIVGDKDYLMHHGIKGQKWGVENGPPYPLNTSKSNKLKSNNNDEITEQYLNKKYFELSSSSNVSKIEKDFNKVNDFIYNYEYVKSIKSVHLEQARKIAALMQYLEDPNPENYKFHTHDALGNPYEIKAQNMIQALTILYNKDSVSSEEGDEDGSIYKGYLVYTNNKNEKEWNKMAYAEEKRNKEILKEYNDQMKSINGKAYLIENKDDLDYPKLVLEANNKKYVRNFDYNLTKHYQNHKLSQKEIDNLMDNVNKYNSLMSTFTPIDMHNR